MHKLIFFAVALRSFFWLQIKLIKMSKLTFVLAISVVSAFLYIEVRQQSIICLKFCDCILFLHRISVVRLAQVVESDLWESYLHAHLINRFQHVLQLQAPQLQVQLRHLPLPSGQLYPRYNTKANFCNYVRYLNFERILEVVVSTRINLFIDSYLHSRIKILKQ